MSALISGQNKTHNKIVKKQSGIVFVIWLRIELFRIASTGKGGQNDAAVSSIAAWA